jgi:arsenate reductase
MFNLIQEKMRQIACRFDRITEERKIVLQHLAACIRQSIADYDRVDMLYVCTHNARRSHFGQVAAALAAAFYGIEQVYTYSAGTETTHVHIQTIKAIEALGCTAHKMDETSNPKYQINFGGADLLTCYSKTIHDNVLPMHQYIAVMTCTDAEQNCPFLPLATFRIGLPYTDPKIADGTGNEALIYAACLEEILTESLYVFAQLK